MELFAPALEYMQEQGSSTYGPCSWRDYLNHYGLEVSGRTPQYLSVDDISSLNHELRVSDTMVLRLGSRKGKLGADFGLIQYANESDYFIHDKQLINGVVPEVYISSASLRKLFAFQMFPKLTETSLVNLAIASGLLKNALGISDSQELLVPATGRSTYTFEFSPDKRSEICWTHNNGQVEIDAVFIGTKNGNETVYVVEAKVGKPTGSLAKHKLVYGVAALSDTVPVYMDVVPVYLKTWHENDGQHYMMSECSRLSSKPFVLPELSVKRVAHYVLPGFGG
jgi:hypothetical protein